MPQHTAELRDVASEETETGLKTGSLDPAWLARVDKGKVKSQIEGPRSTKHLPTSLPASARLPRRARSIECGPRVLSARPLPVQSRDDISHATEHG